LESKLKEEKKRPNLRVSPFIFSIAGEIGFLKMN
jgi:hypothetical protein